MLGGARQARPHPVRAGRRSRPARGGSVRACSDEAADQDQGGGAARRHLAPGSMTMARIDDLKAKTDDQLDEELGNLKREAFRSEERRVGKEGVRTCRSRWSPKH